MANLKYFDEITVKGKTYQIEEEALLKFLYEQSNQLDYFREYGLTKEKDLIQNNDADSKLKDLEQLVVKVFYPEGAKGTGLFSLLPPPIPASKQNHNYISKISSGHLDKIKKVLKECYENNYLGFYSEYITFAVDWWLVKSIYSFDHITQLLKSDPDKGKELVLNLLNDPNAIKSDLVQEAFEYLRFRGDKGFFREVCKKIGPRKKGTDKSELGEAQRLYVSAIIFYLHHVEGCEISSVCRSITTASYLEKSRYKFIRQKYYEIKHHFSSIDLQKLARFFSKK